jgi:hypothetical protein
VARQAVPPTAAPAAAAAEPLSGPPGAAAGSADQPFEWTARTISAVVIAFMVASLAASAGVGGGAFFVPLYMLALGYGELLLPIGSGSGSAVEWRQHVAVPLVDKHRAAPRQQLPPSLQGACRIFCKCTATVN